MSFQNQAYIYVAGCNGDTFTNTLDNDMLIYPATTSQRILLGNALNGAAALTVTSNLGINFNAPTQALCVGGNILMSNFGAVTLFTSNSSIGIGTSNPMSTLAVVGGASVGAAYSNADGPTNGFIVQGNVGIGKSNPSVALDVVGSATVTSNFQTSTLTCTSNVVAPQGSLIFTNATSNGALGVRADAFVYLSAVAPYIQTSGDNSALPATGSNARPLFLYGSNITYDARFGPHWFRSTNVQLGGTSLVASNLLTVAGAASIGAAYSNADGPTNGFIVQGNVGIGKSNPASALDVNGTISLNGTTFVDSSRNGFATSLSASNIYLNAGLFQAESNNLVMAGAGPLNISGETAVNLIMDNNSNNFGNTAVCVRIGYGNSNTTSNFTEYMRVSHNGLVGIGTTTPAERLHVAGDAVFARTGSTRMYLNRDTINDVNSLIFTRGGGSATNGEGEIGMTGCNMAFRVNDTLGSFSTRMTLTKEGFLGLGTAGPAESLHVVNKIYSQSQFLCNSNDSAAAPSYTFREDSNTGMFHPSNDAVGFSTNGSERMRITDGGNVGIGTQAPFGRLQICNPLFPNSNNVVIEAGTTAGGAFVGWSAINFNGFFNVSEQRINVNKNRWRIIVDQRDATDTMIFDTWNGTTSVNVLTALSNGNVGIGTLSPGYRLEVAGAIYASGDITALSDRRYKTNIEPINGAMDIISNLKGCTYYWNSNQEANLDPRALNKRHVGLIAQEVLEVLPEVVTYDDTKDKYGINYGSLSAVLIEAVKELRLEVATLRQEIAELKKGPIFA